MIIYNKEFQRILSVEIKDYERISGKYKVGEKNGKGREYILKLNSICFEGNYLKGKRNGKGKEYNEDGKLRFEGEYFYGIKWTGKGYNEMNDVIYELKNGNGEVKEYYYNGKLEFEGEYLEGKRNGKGKEYDYNGNLEFEGEYLNGQRNGKGKEYNPDGKLKFEDNIFMEKGYDELNYNKK